MKKDVERVSVEVGQVWADNDSRVTGRTLRVDYITSVIVSRRAVEYAECTVLTDPHKRPIRGRTSVGKKVRIRTDRMRPTSTGYRLVSPATLTAEMRDAEQR